MFIIYFEIFYLDLSFFLTGYEKDSKIIISFKNNNYQSLSFSFRFNSFVLRIYFSFFFFLEQKIIFHPLRFILFQRRNKRLVSKLYFLNLIVFLGINFTEALCVVYSQLCALRERKESDCMIKCSERFGRSGFARSKCYAQLLFVQRYFLPAC